MNKMVRDIFFIVIGCLSYALALTVLAMPNELTEGGVPGAALILYYAFGWSPGVTTFVLTSAIMIIGFKYIPRRAMFLSLLTLPLISGFMFLTEGLAPSLGDPLISAIFAGLFIGVGIGFILRTGSTMGGTSLIARMCQDKLGWDLVRTIFVLDVLIVLSGVAIIGPLHTMYTMVALFIAKQATDLIIEGLDRRKAVSIISAKAPNIADEIIKRMNIGATVFNGIGGYKKQETNMTYVIINKYQLIRLRRVINEIDPDAFVVIHDVRDVLGGSFAWEETLAKQK